MKVNTIKKIKKQILNILSYSLIFITVILIIFGFGEDGFRILKEINFWVIIDTLWILAILLFIIESKL